MKLVQTRVKCYRFSLVILKKRKKSFTQNIIDLFPKEFNDDILIN